MNGKKLYRTENSYKMISGVCGGIGEYFDVDPTLIRIAWVIFAFMGGSGVLLYLACAFIIPKKSDVYPGY